jgi:hypothetical protein
MGIHTSEGGERGSSRKQDDEEGRKERAGKRTYDSHLKWLVRIRHRRYEVVC